MEDDGGTTTFGYDGQGRLASISDTAAGAFGLAYDAADRLTGLTRPNGVDDLGGGRASAAFAGEIVGQVATRRLDVRCAPVPDSVRHEMEVQHRQGIEARAEPATDARSTGTADRCRPSHPWFTGNPSAGGRRAGRLPRHRRRDLPPASPGCRPRRGLERPRDRGRAFARLHRRRSGPAAVRPPWWRPRVRRRRPDLATARHAVRRDEHGRGRRWIDRDRRAQRARRESGRRADLAGHLGNPPEPGHPRVHAGPGRPGPDVGLPGHGRPLGEPRRRPGLGAGPAAEHPVSGRRRGPVGDPAGRGHGRRSCDLG
ncbi:MAG: hypothetical protein C0498_14325 [Anaerolinea sp.]|nr:hypothetical protein [Anaerolinea sp.]